MAPDRAYRDAGSHSSVHIELSKDPLLHKHGAHVRSRAIDGSESLQLSGPTSLGSELGIHWRAPSLMLVTCLMGIAAAIGHHLYYAFLNGQRVINIPPHDSKWSLAAVRDSQEWKIRFGTAFAFVVQTLLASAISTAYEQEIWATTRHASLSVNGLDGLFSAHNSIWGLFTFEVWLKARLGALVALLRWLAPLSAVITPATLTVVPSVLSTDLHMSVPMVDFNNSVPLYNYNGSALASDENTADNGVLPYLSRLTAAVASGMQIIPMKEVQPNSTYTLSFSAPSFQCTEPATNVQKYIEQVLSASSSWSNGDALANLTEDIGTATNLQWLAFPPVSLALNPVLQGANVDAMINDTKAFVKMCVIGADIASNPPADFQNIESDVQCEGITARAYFDQGGDGASAIYNGGRLWIWTKAGMLDCALRVTAFDAEFSSQSQQQIIDSAYTFRWTDQEPYGSHFAIAQSISNILTGALREFNYGLYSYKTSIAQTALFGALTVKTAGDQSLVSGFADTVLTPAVVALARNKSVGELVEELSRNISLSLFSASDVLLPEGVNTVVRQVTPVNIYSYNMLNLVLAYAVVAAFAVAASIVGLIALVRNGVSHDTSFSSIVRTTRNSLLDYATRGQTLGALPISKDLAHLKLTFGLLKEVGQDGEEISKATFGEKHELSRLKKV